MRYHAQSQKMSMDTEMTDEERRVAIERDTMVLAQLIYDIYQDKKQEEAIENVIDDN